MTVEVGYGPIVTWPGALRPPSARTDATFRAEWPKTWKLLAREVTHLGATEATLLLAHPARAFRQDGGIHARYQGNQPDHPGVVLVAATHRGTQTYATDAFTDWRDNVRAVGLGLEALRLVGRYGIADAGQQYVGFGELGTGMAMGARREPMSLLEAASVLAGAQGVAADLVLASPETARACYRAAQRLLHPDVGGSGDSERMARLTEAWRLLQEHHGMRAMTG